MRLAESIARTAHAAQTDRAGRPYIEHIEHVVANLLRRWPDSTADEIAAAWLHDVVEDTPWTSQQLIDAGVSRTAVSIVVEVSRPPEGHPDRISYREWIDWLACRGTLSAVHVKLADNEANSTKERVDAIPEGAEMLRKRYQPAKRRLEARIERDGRGHA